METVGENLATLRDALTGHSRYFVKTNYTKVKHKCKMKEFKCAN